MAVHREKYDLAVSRAVADLAVLSEYALPFVKKDGLFAAYKSAGSGEETKRAEKSLKVMGGTIETISTFTIPGSEIERSIICIRKQKQTPGKYPRKAGMPGKNPIL